MNFFDISKMPGKQMAPGSEGKFIHSENNTISFWNIAAGTIIPLHHHVHESTLILLEGQIKMTIGEETRLIESGMVAYVPSNITHHAEVLTNCRMIDIFFPLREEFTKPVIKS